MKTKQTRLISSNVLQVCGVKFMTKLRVVYSQFKKDCVVVSKP